VACGHFRALLVAESVVAGDFQKRSDGIGTVLAFPKRVSIAWAVFSAFSKWNLTPKWQDGR